MSEMEMTISDAKIEAKPVELLHIFGFNSLVPIINLTTQTNNKKFACASSHVLQIFSYQGNEQKCYMGHENQIFALETDSTGRFILSADVQGVINIWDMQVANEFPHPIRTIYETNDFEKLIKVTMSFDGKVILTVTESLNEKIFIIKLWQWSMSSENDKPSDLLELQSKYGKVENIRFNSNFNEMSMFVATCSNGVIFGQWDSVNKKLLKHSPARAISISFHFIDTIFIEKSDKAISITRCGSGIIWSNSIGSTDSEMKNDRLFFRKEFLKSIKLCESPLSVIKSIDKCIMIADFNGRIRFYDQELKILFWFPSNDFNEPIVTLSFDILSSEKSDEDKQQMFRINDFLLQTKSEIYAVDFTQMKFSKIFYKSEDFITAFDISPINNKKLICCANYTGRIMMYDYEKKILIVEHQLKLLRRKSSMSDVEVIEIPHISSLAFSRNGFHLMAGLDNGTIINLDPTVLREIRHFNFTQEEILSIKFSPDSQFVTFYDAKCNIIVLRHDKATEEEWIIVGRKSKNHSKAIVDTLYITSTIPSSNTTQSHPHQSYKKKQPVPRLISLGEDRQIIEYDLNESMKENSTSLHTTFSKRIFQVSIPSAITLIYNSKKNEEQILIADNKGKFKLFDKATFEILATYSAPIYDSYARQFDANTFAGLTPYSKFFIFSTNKNICLYAMPIDGNLFRSLGVMGHVNGIKYLKVDSTRHVLFTIGHKCQSVFMWNINFEPLFEHLSEGGEGLEPYLHLLPGGKYGKFFQDMLDLYYYMLMLSNTHSIDDNIVKHGLDISEIPDFMRGMGFYLSDYEIECINHELQICGKRKISFEELLKLYLNHAPSKAIQQHDIDEAIRNLLDLHDISSREALVDRKSLVEILTCGDGDKTSVENAELYLKELLGNSSQVFLKDFLKNVLKLDENVENTVQ